MKYLYIKILILLAILIPSTLVIESNAAGSPFVVYHGEFTKVIYFPNTGNLCGLRKKAKYGAMSMDKLVLPKNLTTTSYKKLKGTYEGYAIDKQDKSYRADLAYNWKKRNIKETYTGNNEIIFGRYPVDFNISEFNLCNNNKIAVILKKYIRENKNYLD